MIPTLEDVQAELCVRSLAEFTREAWHVVEPAIPLAWNWHIPAVTDHLEAVSRFVVNDEDDDDARIKDLLINIPPGHAKSILVDVMWPAWEWLQWPWMRTLFSSYSMALSRRDSLRCRDLIKSEWYQATFQPDWQVREDQDAKELFANTVGGFRQAISVKSTTTGLRGDKVVGDDLLSVMDADSQTERENAGKFWLSVMPTRLNDRRTGARVLIQQRVHEEDPTGLSLQKGGWTHLCLPSEYDETRHCRTSIGFEDPRTVPGEILFPEMFPREVLNSDKRDLGAAGYGAQHQQNPTPAGGLIFKRVWWRYWHPRGTAYPPVAVKVSETETVYVESIEIPENLEELVQSWDCAFKKKEDTDYIAGGVWARSGPKVFLMDRVNARITFTETLQAIRDTTAKWPRAIAKLVENKANGPAVIDTLTQEIPGMIGIEPDGSKEARAHSVTPYMEAGDVFVPHPFLYDWVDAYLTQHDGFPKAGHDDEVDQTTQALRRLFGGGGARSDDEFGKEFWDRR